MCDTIDQYMAQGLVIFRGGQGAGGQQVANPEWRYVVYGGVEKKAQNFAATKIATNSSQPQQKTKTILLPIANCSKIWKKVCFDSRDALSSDLLYVWLYSALKIEK